MEIKGHTVRVDDEVWERLNGLPGKSMNEGLRALLIDGVGPSVTADTRIDELLELARRQLDGEQVMECLHRFAEERKGRQASTATGYDPRTVEGVQAGARDLPKNARCLHCGQKFAGSKYATLCHACEDGGHRGDPRDCSECTAGASI